MVYHERTYPAFKLVSISKKPARQSWFFHIWIKRLILKAFDLNAELSDPTKKPPLWRLFCRENLATDTKQGYGRQENQSNNSHLF